MKNKKIIIVYMCIKPLNLLQNQYGRGYYLQFQRSKARLTLGKWLCPRSPSRATFHTLSQSSYQVPDPQDLDKGRRRRVSRREKRQSSRGKGLNSLRRAEVSRRVWRRRMDLPLHLSTYWVLAVCSLWRYKRNKGRPSCKWEQWACPANPREAPRASITKHSSH